MRFFRIPGFTGIEAHRDDADRGSLRVVEGCLPHGTGGLRSGPVWKKMGDVNHTSSDDKNIISAGDDGAGNSLVFASRNCIVHDLAVFSQENTDFKAIGDTYNVAVPVDGLFERADVTLSSIGNLLISAGDGSNEAIYLGKVGLDDVYPDAELYRQEWSRFPNCQYYVRGPKNTIFASGNPDKPLTVYISEPAGMTSSLKDNPYSTEDSGIYNSGMLSTVDILGSNASRITALSTRGAQVVVHTDKGCYLLYAPSADQAETGYRVEQAPATNFSAAVSHKVVSGDGGDQTFWVGHDGQIYKDEAASRGSADLKSFADQDQANWKSKGAWEHELPSDLSKSFSAFCAQTGDYFFFTESEESKSFDYQVAAAEMPANISSATDVHVSYTCENKICDDGRCCRAVNREPDPDNGFHPTLTECIINSDCESFCCTDALSLTSEETNLKTLAQYEELFSMCHGNCSHPDPGLYEIDECGQCSKKLGVIDLEDPALGFTKFLTLPECLAAAEDVEISEGCFWDFENCGDCEDTLGSGGRFSSLEECEEARATDPCHYALEDCECVQSAGGVYSTLGECLIAQTLECSYYDYDKELCGDCLKMEDQSGSGGYKSLEACRQARESDVYNCEVYYAAGHCQDVGGQACVHYPEGTTLREQDQNNPEFTGHAYMSMDECYNDDLGDICNNGYNLYDCGCEPTLNGTYDTVKSCLRAADVLDAFDYCPPEPMEYTFTYKTDSADIITAVSTLFSESGSISNFSDHAVVSSYNVYESNNLLKNYRPDSDNPDAVYFYIKIVPEEGYSYELSVPVPGADGPASTLYSSTYVPNDGTSVEGELKLNEVQVFSVTADLQTDYTSESHRSSPTTPAFVLKRKPLKYNFLGCSSGLENACLRDDEHGTLTLDECYDKYGECMGEGVDCDSTLQIYEVNGPDCVCATDLNNVNNLTECDCEAGGFPVTGTDCNTSYDFIDCSQGCVERQGNLGFYPTMTACDDAYTENCP